jgi:hypothetical protein
MRWIVSDRTGWFIIGLSVLAVVSMFIDLTLTIVLLAGCLLLLFGEHYRLLHSMRILIEHLRDNPFDAKLEVGVGIWGEFCYTLNRFLQQWRTEQHLQRLQLTQPALRQLNPITINPPLAGTVARIAVLSVGRLAIIDPLDEVRARIALIKEQIGNQQALIDWRGDHLLLIFGALHPDPDPIQRALALIDEAVAAAHNSGLPLPPFTLCSGIGRVGLVPIIGLYVSGEALDQATILTHQTLPGMITCNEEAYFHLRSTGQLPLTAVRSSTTNRGYTLAVNDIFAHQRVE